MKITLARLMGVRKALTGTEATLNETPAQVFSDIEAYANGSTVAVPKIAEKPKRIKKAKASETKEEI